MELAYEFVKRLVDLVDAEPNPRPELRDYAAQCRLQLQAAEHLDRLLKTIHEHIDAWRWKEAQREIELARRFIHSEQIPWGSYLEGEVIRAETFLDFSEHDDIVTRVGELRTAPPDDSRCRSDTGDARPEQT